MAGWLLTQSATTLCAHSGQAQPGSINARVKASGAATVTLDSAYSIASCTLPPPPLANGPCVSAQFSNGATRVKSGGRALLLHDSQATCVPTGTSLVISNFQTRVKAV
jgi:hypothetical protein